MSPKGKVADPKVKKLIRDTIGIDRFPISKIQLAIDRVQNMRTTYPSRADWTSWLISLKTCSCVAWGVNTWSNSNSYLSTQNKIMSTLQMTSLFRIWIQILRG